MWSLGLYESKGDKTMRRVDEGFQGQKHKKTSKKANYFGQKKAQKPVEQSLLKAWFMLPATMT